MSTYFLSGAELELTRAKVAKINTRAAKRGFTGGFELKAVKATRTDELTRMTHHGYETTLTGTAPSYEGWTFMAAVDVAASGAVVLRYAPGMDDTIVKNTDIDPGVCEHCNTKRTRKHTYLLQGEDGAIVQVGKTCIKDFLGWDVSPTFIDTEATEEQLFGGRGEGHPDHDLLDIARLSFACEKAYGFKPASFDHSTKSTVSSLIHPSRHAKLEQERLATLDEIKPFYLSDDELRAKIDELRISLTAPEGFEANLLAVISGNAVDCKHLGLAVAMVRAKARPAKAEPKPEKPKSNWLGSLGEKLEVTGHITAFTIETMYGSSRLVKLVTPEGSVVKMFTTAAWSWDIPKDDGIEGTIIGEVKEHDVYEGSNETLIKRPKLIAAPAAESK